MHSSDIQNIHIQQSILTQSPSFSNGVWDLDSEFWEPIKLSTLAGLSTCVGASVAFVVSADDCTDTAKSTGNKHTVGPDLLAFSLALAGSVMITVCLVSIIPECLSIDNANVESGSSDTWNIFGHIFASQLIRQRAVGFAVGWGVFALLSQWLAILPEQDEWSGLLLVGDDNIPLAPANNVGVTLAGSQVDNGIKSSIIDDTNTHLDNAQSTSKQQSSWRLTILLFLSLLIHNFPEGLAVAFSAASSNASPSSSSSVVIATPATDTMFDPSVINPITYGTFLSTEMRIQLSQQFLLQQ